MVVPKERPAPAETGWFPKAVTISLSLVRHGPLNSVSGCFCSRMRIEFCRGVVEIVTRASDALESKYWSRRPWNVKACDVPGNSRSAVAEAVANEADHFSPPRQDANSRSSVS